MKKNISINIGGIIFHIEEDGYDQLKNYLDSITKYFSNFEDSKEIVEDIENRIAEILLGKLTEGKQVIIISDINELITTMGTVADFEATIETDPDEEVKEEISEDTQGQQEESKQTGEESRKLFRDSKRRILGGVAAGIAHYFRIDPLWIRLIFIALFFNVFFWGLSGGVFLAYIILWIVVPGNEKLDDDKSIKKLYRNTEDRVFGGVSSGIAAYFGTDTTLIRLLFVLSIFIGGSGILLYIILWIITPEAKSITEKMQMQGEPVTLSNIEKNVKKSFNVKEGEENVFVKILLFPFRLIALIFNALSDLLGPLLKFSVEAIRILFGVLVILIGFTFMISFIITLGVFLGIITSWTEYAYVDQIPIEFFEGLVNPLSAFAIFGLTFIPALALVLLGIIIITKKAVVRSYVGWSLFGIWFVCLIIAAFTIPKTVREFTAFDDVRKEVEFQSPDGIPTLKYVDEDDFDYGSVTLRLRGHSDSTFKAVIRYESRGASKAEARENAEQTKYEIQEINGNFYFNSSLDFQGSKFRFQEADVIFYLPFNKTFRMDREIAEILTNTLYRDGYRVSQMEGNDWVFTTSGLKCLTCAGSNSSSTETYDSDDFNGIDWTLASGSSITYEFDDFDRVEVTSMVNVKITKSNQYRIEIVGEEETLEEVFVKQFGGRLEIDNKNDWQLFNKKDKNENQVWVFISMPDLEYLELTGGCAAEIKEFDSPDLDLIATGGSLIIADVEPDYLNLSLTGASKMRLSGIADKIDAKIVGASSLEAIDMKARNVSLDLAGASKAETYATSSLDVNAYGISSVLYKGTNQVNIESDGLSTVEKY
jgi:phage shock protein PspC (stress-responsive transcriptional regulator)